MVYAQRGAYIDCGGSALRSETLGQQVGQSMGQSTLTECPQLALMYQLDRFLDLVQEFLIHGYAFPLDASTRTSTTGVLSAHPRPLSAHPDQVGKAPPVRQTRRSPDPDVR